MAIGAEQRADSRLWQRKKEVSFVRAIVIYYSRSGKTEKLVSKIQKEISCDVLKIQPKEAYGSYLSSCMRVIRERRDKIAAGYNTPTPDLSSYQVVLLGYPVWAHDMPDFVAAFIKECQLEGKILIPFATFTMTGISCTMRTLQECCRGARIILPFEYGTFKKQSFQSWIGSIKKLLQKK